MKKNKGNSSNVSIISSIDRQKKFAKVISLLLLFSLEVYSSNELIDPADQARLKAEENLNRRFPINGLLSQEDSLFIKMINEDSNNDPFNYVDVCNIKNTSAPNEALHQKSELSHFEKLKAKRQIKEDKKHKNQEVVQKGISDLSEALALFADDDTKKQTQGKKRKNKSKTKSNQNKKENAKDLSLCTQSTITTATTANAKELVLEAPASPSVPQASEATKKRKIEKIKEIRIRLRR